MIDVSKLTNAVTANERTHKVLDDSFQDLLEDIDCLIDNAVSNGKFSVSDNYSEYKNRVFEVVKIFTAKGFVCTISNAKCQLTIDWSDKPKPIDRYPE